MQFLVLKNGVYRSLAELPDDEQKRAAEVYGILQNMEWLIALPFLIAALSILRFFDPFISHGVDIGLGIALATVVTLVELLIVYLAIAFMLKWVFDHLCRWQARKILALLPSHWIVLQCIKGNDPNIIGKTKSFLSH